MKRTIFYMAVGLLLTACGSDQSDLTPTQVYNQFIDCKETTDDKHGCKEYVAMLIDAQYGVSDFDMGDSYVPYDEIAGMVIAADNWTNIGWANDQDVLNKALEYANNDRAVIVLDPDKPNNGVALVMPGEMSHSSGWDMDVPVCAFLHMKNPEKSFLDQTLAYAFGKAKGLMVYARD